MRTLPLALLVLLSTPCSASSETPPIEFVGAFIRTLGEVEQARVQAATELKSGGNSFAVAGCVHSMEALDLALANGVNTIAVMKLRSDNKNVRDVPLTFAQQFKLLGEIYAAMGATCSDLLAAKPGANYGAIIAKFPKYRADAEYTWKTLLQGSPLVFATLIADKPDSQGHISRLSITRKERDALVRDINRTFGRKLDQASQDDVISIAWVLRNYLTKKGYRCSDE